MIARFIAASLRASVERGRAVAVEAPGRGSLRAFIAAEGAAAVTPWRGTDCEGRNGDPCIVKGVPW